jgi:putative ABC transport system permease protein
MGLHVGDEVALGGHQVAVVGIAVSAALPPYPQLCTVGCILDRPGWDNAQPGLVWATRALVSELVTPAEPVVLFEFLTLEEATSADRFVARHQADGGLAGHPQLTSWQDVAGRQAEQLANERVVVVFGSTLLVILALASLVVLVGGRMSDELRRVGMLKAAGATPGFVTRLLLVSNLAIGVVASLAGVVAGRLLAPRLVTHSAGLLGHPGATRVTVADALVVVVSVVLMVALASTLPAWRAARVSTVRALASAGHRPRRGRLLVALSRMLPTPALVGCRMVSRRPLRALLATLAIAVSSCGSVVVLYAQAGLDAEHQMRGGPADPQVSQLHTVMIALTVLLAIMAAVNLVFVARATAVDSRVMLAVMRALGATPGESAGAMALAQLLPAALGLLLGGASGIALFHALSGSHVDGPSPAELAGLAVVTLLLVTALTAVPGRLEARRPIVATLRET